MSRENAGSTHKGVTMTIDRTAILTACIQSTTEIFKSLPEDQRPDDGRRSCDLIGAYAVRMFKAIERHHPELFEEAAEV